MPRQQNREREPEDVATTVEDGEKKTVGQSGNSYSGEKRGPKFASGDYKMGAMADPNRRRRMGLLVEAFVLWDDDIMAAQKDVLCNAAKRNKWKLSRYDPNQKKWFKTNELDPWLEEEHECASKLMEVGVLMNAFELAMSRTPQAMPAAKSVLPAINKNRYNLGVQKQQTANEGLEKALKLVSDKPLSLTEIQKVLIINNPMHTDVPLEAMKVPTLDEAVAEAKHKGRFIEVRGIEEDEDLKVLDAPDS